MSPVATPAVNEQEGPQQEPSSHNITSLVLAIPRDIWKRSRQVLSAIQLATETSTELLFKRTNRNIVLAGHFRAAWHGRHLLTLEAHLVRNYVHERHPRGGRSAPTKGVFSSEGWWQKFPLVPPPCLFTAKFLWGSEPVLEQTGRSGNP